MTFAEVPRSEAAAGAPMSAIRSVARGSCLISLVALAAGCVVAPDHDRAPREGYYSAPQEGYYNTPREGYYDREHHRYYHDRAWHECDEHDEDCRDRPHHECHDRDDEDCD